MVIPAVMDGMLMARDTATKKQNGFVQSCATVSVAMLQHSPKILHGKDRSLQHPSQAEAHPRHKTAAMMV